ncbi:MAG TPA: hypothetical protein VF776_09635, partial [Sphingomicrobium sp.]
PLAGAARNSGVLPVGVFKNASLTSVTGAAASLNLHAVQLHGGEDPGYVASLRRELSETCEIWTALSVGRDALTSRGGDRLLFDNGDGGSGRSFDWSQIIGRSDLQRSLVAGGIGPDNADAARALGAYAIDIGSAVDQRPGKKSPQKIAALFDTLRPASLRRLRQCA